MRNALMYFHQSSANDHQISYTVFFSNPLRIPNWTAKTDDHSSTYEYRS